MKMRLISILTVIIVMMSIFQVSFAAGKSSYRFYGFSSDLKYCAFETYGYHDGSGFPYSNIYFVDVDKNKYSVSPFTLCDEKYQDVSALRQVNMKRASSYFTKYKIGKNDVGKLVTANPKNKYECSFTVGGRVYGLKLTQKNYGKSSFDTDMKIFKLKLIKPNKKEKILQNDTYLPKSRGEVLGYSIMRVYNKGNKICVFLECKKVGFEGPDYVQMVVTGTLD